MLKEGDVIQSIQFLFSVCTDSLGVIHVGGNDISNYDPDRGKARFLVERVDAEPPFKNEVASYNKEAQRITARRLGLDGKYDPHGTVITFHTTQGWTDYISSFNIIGHMQKNFA